jgi:hypothetical protein
MAGNHPAAATLWPKAHEIDMTILFIKLPAGHFFLVIRDVHCADLSLTHRLHALKSWHASTNR